MSAFYVIVLSLRMISCYCYCCIPYWFVCNVESNYSNLTELFERASAGVEVLFMQGCYGAADIAFFLCEDVRVLRMSSSHISSTHLHASKQPMLGRSVAIYFPCSYYYFCLLSVI